jgi:putative SOS response-associated peptidase YedK
MCGRFLLRKVDEVLAEMFAVAEIMNNPPRYNIAPAQPVLCVKQDDHGERQWVTYRWGLVPNWSADPKAAFKNINARSETAAKSPAFRDAFKKRRCLIPADGFYEWSGPPKHKRATFFHLKDDSPFAFAGLFEHWERDGQALDTCALLTTEANAVVKPIHGRMPVLLAREDFAGWLDEAVLPGPYPAKRMAALAVGPRVNNAKNDGPECLEPESPDGGP